MRKFWVVFIVLWMTSMAAQAIQVVTADRFSLDATSTATNECWILAPDVSFHGTAQDDIFAVCAGNKVGLGHATLAGMFQNDVSVIAAAIDFSGTAKEHARFLANEITMKGDVEISAVAIGNTVTLATNSVIRGDAVLLGQSVVVAGTIAGNVKVLANSVTLSGTVQGDIRIAADDIILMPGTRIGGNLVYTSTKDLFLDPSKVQLDGQLIRKEIKAAASPTAYDIFVSQAYFYLCALVAGLPFIALFPRYTGLAVRHIRQSVWKCALVGTVALCLIPIASLFILFTLIGIPLGLLLLLAYAIMLYLTKIVVALGIGGIVLRRRGPQPFSRVFAALSLGLIAIYLLAALPYGVGSLVVLAVALTGLGGMVLAIFSSQVPPELPIPMPLPPSMPGTASSSSPSQKDESQEEPTKKE